MSGTGEAQVKVGMSKGTRGAMRPSPREPRDLASHHIDTFPFRPGLEGTPWSGTTWFSRTGPGIRVPNPDPRMAAFPLVLRFQEVSQRIRTRTPDPLNGFRRFRE